MSRRLGGGFWPSATQRALLEVALGPTEQAAARWNALQPLDLSTLEPGSFGLLPLLYERLQDIEPDEPQLPRLFGTYRSIWYRNQLLVDRLAVLLPLLRERAGVEPVLVGGMSALLHWYPRLGLRPVPQLELIVERSAAADAAKVSTYAGWRHAWQTATSTILRDDSGRTLVIHRGAPPALVGPLREDGLKVLRERTVDLGEVAGSPSVLDAGGELLFACATGARTTPIQTCQWLVDVHRILHSPEPPAPEELLERTRRVHLMAPVGATLGYLAGIADDDVLEPYLAHFDAEPLGRRDRMAFTLSGIPGPRLAGTAQVLGIYLQSTADDSPLRAAVGFPRHLQERWGARTLAEVPLLALRKGLRVAASQPLPAGRNRSASSRGA